MSIFYTQKKNVLTLVLALLMGIGLQAQDARFAQFYATPLQLNPALTGVYAGQTRLIANYRELYSSILGSDRFRTISACVDMRRALNSGDYVGLGLYALRDDAGNSNFSRSQAMLSASFLKQMGGSRYGSGDQYLVAGAQLGMGQRGFDSQKLWFSEQFFVDASSRQAYVNRALDSGEDFANNNTGTYLDLNAGLLYYATYDDNQSFYIGAAMQHIAEPDISIVGENTDRLYRRLTAHAGGELPLNDALSLLPAAAVMSQGPSLSTTFGLNLRYNNHEWREVAIRAGLWGHLSNQLTDGLALDALVVSAILEMERLQFGLSYDITTSLLAAANNSRGAFELSIIYVAPEKGRSRVTCPKF